MKGEGVLYTQGLISGNREWGKGGIRGNCFFGTQRKKGEWGGEGKKVESCTTQRGSVGKGVRG